MLSILIPVYNEERTIVDVLNKVQGVSLINDLKKETMLVMNNLKAILENENLSFENVIKSTIFLCDMGNFKEVNEIYGSFFNKGNEPARETVEVSKLPLGVNVEISMIAVFN